MFKGLTKSKRVSLALSLEPNEYKLLIYQDVSAAFYFCPSARSWVTFRILQTAFGRWLLAPSPTPDLKGYCLRMCFKADSLKNSRCESYMNFVV